MAKNPQVSMGGFVTTVGGNSPTYFAFLMLHIFLIFERTAVLGVRIGAQVSAHKHTLATTTMYIIS